MSRTSTIRRLRSEAGITIVETVVAATILLGGIMAAFLAMDASSSATKTAERQAAVGAVAERAIERLQSMSYSQLELCETPVDNASTGATNGAVENPDFYVETGNRYFISSDYRNPSAAALTGTPANGEPFVLNDTNCVLGTTTAVHPGPIAFSHGGVTGEYWRFITWKDDVCNASVPGSLGGWAAWLFSVVNAITNWLTGTLPGQAQNACDDTQDAKRITVAVVVDKVDDFGPRKPTWASTLVPNSRILTSNTLYQFP